MKNNNYITDFKCTYNLIDYDEDSDNLYRIQLLQAFDLKIFDDTIINDKINILYNEYKNNYYIKKLIEKIKENNITNDDICAFMYYFSYDNFYNFHDLLTILINNNDYINSDNHHDNNDDNHNKLQLLYNKLSNNN